jgi:hypothetical protein
MSKGAGYDAGMMLEDAVIFALRTEQALSPHD